MAAPVRHVGARTRWGAEGEGAEREWEREREKEKEGEWEREWEQEGEGERDRDQEREQERDQERERDREQEQEWDREREEEGEREREKEKEWDRERELQREREEEEEGEREREKKKEWEWEREEKEKGEWEREWEPDREREEEREKEREEKEEGEWDEDEEEEEEWDEEEERECDEEGEPEAAGSGALRSVFPRHPRLFADTFPVLQSYRLFGRVLRIRQQHGPGMGMAANVWEAALALARFLEREHFDFRGLSVIELGAGTGILGILAAMLGAHLWGTYGAPRGSGSDPNQRPLELPLSPFPSPGPEAPMGSGRELLPRGRSPPAGLRPGLRPLLVRGAISGASVPVRPPEPSAAERPEQGGGGRIAELLPTGPAPVLPGATCGAGGGE